MKFALSTWAIRNPIPPLLLFVLLTFTGPVSYTHLDVYKRQAFYGIVNFVQIPLVVLGGVFFSVQAFPDWLRTISQLSPLTQMNTAMQALIFDGVGLSNVWTLMPQLVGLLAWSILSLVFARWKFRW